MDEKQRDDLDSERRLAALSAKVDRNTGDIDDLTTRADEAHEHADAMDHRTDAQGARIDTVESRLDIAEQLIEELHDAGMLNRDKAEQLTEALKTSRQIGAAVGIIMATQHTTEEAAFVYLSTLSQDTNRKLRDIASELLKNGAGALSAH